MTTQAQTMQPNAPVSADGATRGRPFLTLIEKERYFLIGIATALIAIGILQPYAGIARWLGFALAGYSAVANDSVQTLGTFIASNRQKKWWMLWLFIGGIFLATVAYSWWTYSGDVTYERLASKGFAQTPTSFTYLQLAAPVVLLVLTRMGIPVSTTFLLLTCFATEASSVGKVLGKSVMGYAVAFGAAIVVWMAVAKVIDRWQNGSAAKPWWRVFQWCTTGLLWSVWLMQDASNIAVYLPRSLSWVEFAGFALTIFVGLGLLFRLGGERVQKVVEEKSRVVDVRAATVVDLVYCVILYVFKIQSGIPMSTTWVFVGLLAGREIAITFRGASDHGMKEAFRLAGKDLLYVTIGLVVSIGLALAANDAFREGLLGV